MASLGLAQESPALITAPQAGLDALLTAPQAPARQPPPGVAVVSLIGPLSDDTQLLKGGSQHGPSLPILSGPYRAPLPHKFSEWL